jgi:hypothetical protein
MEHLKSSAIDILDAMIRKANQSKIVSESMVRDMSDNMQAMLHEADDLLQHLKTGSRDAENLDEVIQKTYQTIYTGVSSISAIQERQLNQLDGHVVKLRNYMEWIEIGVRSLISNATREQEILMRRFDVMQVSFEKIQQKIGATEGQIGQLASQLDGLILIPSPRNLLYSLGVFRWPLVVVLAFFLNKRLAVSLALIIGMCSL